MALELAINAYLFIALNLPIKRPYKSGIIFLSKAAYIRNLVLSCLDIADRAYLGLYNKVLVCLTPNKVRPESQDLNIRVITLVLACFEHDDLE